MSRVPLYKHAASKDYNLFDILEDIHHTCSASFKSWQMTALGLRGWLVCGLRVKHHENCFGQKKLHEHRGKSVMVTSNIEKNCYGYIKHWENLLWSHQTSRKSVMVTSNILRKLVWSHQILRIYSLTIMITLNIEKTCYGHIKHRGKSVMVTSNIEKICFGHIKLIKSVMDMVTSKLVLR